MRKLIVIGDIHGNPLWKQIVKKYDKEDVLFIFLGDYFDSFKYNLGDQLYNYNEIINYKVENPDNVILLIGNHDWEYFPEKQDRGLISGFQGGVATQNIGYAFTKTREHLQLAYHHEDILFTHAGVSVTWLKLVSEHTPLQIPEYNAADMAEFVNHVFVYKPGLLDYISGEDPYGNDAYQSPLWIRPNALMKDNQLIKKKLVQIVGHTKQNQIDIHGKATGKRYFFIDTINTNQEYLIIKNKAFQSGKIYNHGV